MYKYLLSLFVIPHGITDIIFSYENDRLLTADKIDKYKDVLNNILVPLRIQL